MPKRIVQCSLIFCDSELELGPSLCIQAANRRPLDEKMPCVSSTCMIKWCNSLNSLVITYHDIYSQISNIRHQILTVMFLFLSSSCLCPIHWSQVLGREWRYSWSSADRQCSNYIWVINNFVAYWGATYIRGLVVCIIFRLMWARVTLSLWIASLGCVYTTLFLYFLC